jgi:hypothetical protein
LPVSPPFLLLRPFFPFISFLLLFHLSLEESSFQNMMGLLAMRNKANAKHPMRDNKSRRSIRSRRNLNETWYKRPESECGAEAELDLRHPHSFFGGVGLPAGSQDKAVKAASPVQEGFHEGSMD